MMHGQKNIKLVYQVSYRIILYLWICKYLCKVFGRWRL